MQERIPWKEKSETEICQWVSDVFEQSQSNSCPVNRLSVFSEEAMQGSCGECVICREGTYQIMIQAQSMTNGKGNDDDFLIVNDIVEDMILGSCCSYGKEVGKRFYELIECNAEIFAKHYKRKRCDAGVCEKLIVNTPTVEINEGGLLGGKQRRRRSS